MITMYTTPWCGDCVRTKAFLNEKEIPFKQINIEIDKSARELVVQINNGNAVVPTLVFEDGTTMTEPTNNDLAQKILK